MRFKLIVFILMAFAINSSCHEEYYEAELLIQVRGLLSGNPREGIAITVYEYPEDAEEGVYSIIPTTYTDYYGEVLIVGLEPGLDYYVRADALLVAKIKNTGRLSVGANHLTIRIL